MKKLLCGVAACCLGIVLAGPVLVGEARADMLPSLQKAYHEYDQLGVDVIGGISKKDLEAKLARKTAPNEVPTRIIVWQVPFASCDKECLPLLRQWVREGHSVWFYDARYAPYFGMKQYLLSSAQFRGRSEKGDIGPQTVRGMAATVMAMDNHPVDVGVGQCTVFLPLLEEDVYSAVAVEGDTVPLLRFAADSPALAALRREGRGALVFKPLLWLKSLSGERFQYNLLEYSAGFGVPGEGGEGRLAEEIGAGAIYVDGEPAVDAEGMSDAEAAACAVKPDQGIVQGGDAVKVQYRKAEENQDNVLATPLDGSTAARSNDSSELKNKKKHNHDAQPASDRPRDFFYCTDGKVYEGGIADGTLKIETFDSSLVLDRQQVKSIVVGDSVNLDCVEMRDGRVLKGYLIVEKLRFRTFDGDTREVRKSDIVRLEFEN